MSTSPHYGDGSPRLDLMGVGDEDDYVEREELDDWRKALTQTEANEMDELGYDLPQDPPYLKRLEDFLKASTSFTSHRFEKEDLLLLVDDWRRVARENANNEHWRGRYRNALLERYQQMAKAERERDEAERRLSKAADDHNHTKIQLRLAYQAGERLLDHLESEHEKLLLAQGEIETCRDLLDKLDVDRADGLWQELADLVERYR